MRWLKLLALLIASWSVMVVTHETGHIVGGWLGGGTVRYAELRPWMLPHSHFDPDPHPLLTLWSGPLLGATAPLLVAALLRWRWSWFIANFCLLANGTYLAVAWINGGSHLDTPRLLAAGASPAPIAGFCAIAIGLGYLRFRASCIEIFDHE